METEKHHGPSRKPQIKPKRSQKFQVDPKENQKKWPPGGLQLSSKFEQKGTWLQTTWRHRPEAEGHPGTTRSVPHAQILGHLLFIANYATVGGILNMSCSHNSYVLVCMLFQDCKNWNVSINNYNQKYALRLSKPCMFLVNICRRSPLWNIFIFKK